MSIPQNILDEMRRIGVAPPPVSSGGYDDLVNKHVAEQGIDPDLIRSVMGQESRGDPSAVSPKGARGLM